MGASCVTAGVSAELELQWRQITAKSWYTHVSIALLITGCLVDHVCLLERGFAGSAGGGEGSGWSISGSCKLG